MKSYINFFELMSEYESYKNGQDFILPNVNFISENNKLYFNPNAKPASPNIVCIYDVTDVTQETRLCSEYIDSFTTMIVDGEEKEFEQYYQFESTGLHTVEFVIDDNTINTWEEYGQKSDYCMFVYCRDLIRIELPVIFCNYQIEGDFFYDCEKLTEIIFNSKIAPIPYGGNDNMYRIMSGLGNSGVIKYPKGSDYSNLIAVLPEGWSVEEF